MLKPGDKAPAFALPADSGATVRLSAFKGKPVVLYFYPADDTSGCTVEACEFRDSWAEVKQADAVVLGVSPDGVASHRKFRTKHRLPFTLLADEDHAVAARYGVWGEKQMYGRTYTGIRRTTFVIDGKGRIRTVFENVKPKGHAAQVLEAIR
jgi:thioredoxin-dependent peroxiredoxin